MRSCLSLLLIGCLVASFAQAGEWVTDNTGLRNLTVNGIGIAPNSPNTIYIQCSAVGVYKSIDGGATWSKTQTFNDDNGPGFDHIMHEGPAVHPTNPDIAWVASDGQVYKTINGGTTWTLSSTGTTVSGCNGVHGVVVDPNDPDHLFAGTIVSGCSGGVFESTDGGANWTNIAGSDVGGGIGNDAWPIAIDPTDPLRLYCGSPHNSIYRTINGGSYWVNTPPVTGDHSTYEVVVDPYYPQKIWCSEVGGTWLSINYGMTWTRQTHLFNDRAMYAMRFAPSNPSIVYAVVGDTLWRSNNSGISFTAMNDIFGGPRCVEVDPTNPDVVYVGTWGLGMYKSTDGGATVSEINNGLPMTASIRSWFNFGDPVTSGGMYCVLSGNICCYKGPNDAEWSYYSKVPDDYIQIERHRPNRWYAAAGGLWRSLDHGKTWEEIYSKSVDTNLYDFYLDPLQCGRIIIGDRDGSEISESLDGGETWTKLGSVPATDTFLVGISGDPYDSDNILIAAMPGAGRHRQNGYVWRSTDHGQTWSHIKENMFFGDWRIGAGYWLGWYNTMRQEQEWHCDHHLNLDNRVFGSGTFECKIRFIASGNLDMTRWAGFTIRVPDRDSSRQDGGWTVFVRRNGGVVLWSKATGTVFEAPAGYLDASDNTWNKLKLVANGNSLSVYANDALVTTYVDNDHHYDGAGYFAFETCGARTEFDNLDIQAETSYQDSFTVTQTYGASYARSIVADPFTSGRFAMPTQWGGLWQTSDHGATWQRISAENQEGHLFYKPAYSMKLADSMYVSSGYYPNYRVDNYYNNGQSVQKLGPTLSSSSVYMAVDPFDPYRVFASLYGIGPSHYSGDDIIGDPAPIIPVSMDMDVDGDIDQSDFGFFQACYTGAGIPLTDVSCYDLLIDSDDDIDSDDFNIFISNMQGPGIEPDPACDCQ